MERKTAFQPSMASKSKRPAVTTNNHRADLLQPLLRLGFRQPCLEVGTQLGDDRLEFQRMPRGMCL